MKNFIRNFIYIVLPTFVCFICFCIFGIRSFCASASLTLGSGASQSLSSGLSSIFDLSSISASPDPLGFSIGLSRVYDNLDQYLYQKYDYDLSGTMNNTLEGKNALLNGNQNISSVVADSFVNRLSNGIYTGVAELSGAGYALYKGVTSGLSQAKDTFFIGKAQDGIITETLGGVLTYVDDNTLSMYGNALNNSLANNSLLKFSKANNFIYGRSFETSVTAGNGRLVKDIITINQDVVLCSAGIGMKNIFIISPTQNISGSGIEIIGDDSYTITSVSLNTAFGGTINIGGQTYYYGYVMYSTTGGSYYLTSDKYYGSLDNVLGDLDNYGSASLSGVYSLSPDIEAILQQLLGELKGHYVSTSDLETLVDSLSNNGVISNDDVIIDGTTENVPVVDWSQDYIDTLQGIIERILENSAVYDDVISDSNAITPDPEPVTEYNNQGILIPPDFNRDLFSNTFSVFKLPFSFFSIFEPIFYSFGSFAMMFGLFQFVPFALIVIVLIWVIK